MKNIDANKDIELLILLITGLANGKISMLHLQKIFYLLWRSDPRIKDLVEFFGYFKGPYSEEVSEHAKNPMHFPEYWEYIPPKNEKDEKILGGWIELTEKGKRRFQEILKKIKEKAKKDDYFAWLLSALQLSVELYSKLSWKELLLLIYTDPEGREFTEESELSKSIFREREKIVDMLIKRGLIPEDSRESMIKRVEEMLGNE